MPIPIAFVHASPAAITPLAGHYAKHAPDFEVTNVLDDGLLRLFRQAEFTRAKERIAAMVTDCQTAYGTRAALVTCSAIRLRDLESIAAMTGVPCVKIDEPMAKLAHGLAHSSGGPVALVATFPPAVHAAQDLLDEIGPHPVAVEVTLAEPAHAALLAGDFARHDELVIRAARRAAETRPAVILLAQVSMSGVAAHLADLGIPVLTSLDSSLARLRQITTTEVPA